MFLEHIYTSRKSQRDKSDGNRKEIPLKLFKVRAVPVLLYGSETWVPVNKHLSMILARLIVSYTSIGDEILVHEEIDSTTKAFAKG